MNNFYLKLAEDFTYENLLIYRKYCNDELCAYEVRPLEGYHLYDTSAENYELNTDTMEEYRVIIYHNIVILPRDFNFSNFTYKSEKI